MKKTVLIMAGGRGERFWPRSRKDLPKQFLSLTGDGKTMIQLTVERLLPLVDIEDIYVSTNGDYKDLITEQIKDLPKENILCEPIGRNTAPCIGLGAMHMARKYGDAIMYVLPSDHQIKFDKMFLDTLEEASHIADQGRNLVTIGISPTYPETGYGYIKFDPHKSEGRAYKVEKFVEKPDLDKAKEYIAKQEYLWNSGMFTWKVSSILSHMEELMPDTYTKLCTIGAAIGSDKECEVLEEEFTKIESKSIDYGIMEKADDIYTLPGSFGWDDVGSWLAVERLQKSDTFGNVINGDVVAISTQNSIVQAHDKLIAAVGLDNIIIIDTKDAILICDKDHAGEIKNIVENLRHSNREELI